MFGTLPGCNGEKRVQIPPGNPLIQRHMDSFAELLLLWGFCNCRDWPQFKLKGSEPNQDPVHSHQQCSVVGVGWCNCMFLISLI